MEEKEQEVLDGTIKEIVNNLKKLSEISESEETENLSATLGLTLYINDYIKCLGLTGKEAAEKRKEMMAEYTSSSQDELVDAMEKFDNKIKRIVNFK